ncbi:HPF/RaiA family ribosome-associated protein [Phenylobacterium sp. SCN 70-31]|uniref:HPF/RaiA family ribosome-associated protein n=1 Tax=Phenylobacterium sp. SCN 70-31 TaxID=1660129 RepID=UPI00086BEF39|nr:HPF/RaiA family ribosome-associated protein [Phenylobacterium sp. SCN 70-31]ODT89166.1 MAG: hypothetical protein ABS78_02935 [Phenylobacterium sp. SCN 70-31]
MQVLVNTANNVAGRQPWTTDVETMVRERLARFEDRLTRVEVHVVDESAPPTRQPDKRCAIEARPAGFDPVAATETAETIDQATVGALTKLVTALERTFGKTTTRKGH